MSAADDIAADIARIAALRGKSANYYAPAAEPEQRRPSPHLLGLVFTMPPWNKANIAADLRAYDRLPETARRAVRESTMPINAQAYAALLKNVDGDDERLEGLIAPLHIEKCKAWLLRHCGSDHPNVRKY